MKAVQLSYNCRSREIDVTLRLSGKSYGLNLRDMGEKKKEAKPENKKGALISPFCGH